MPNEIKGRQYDLPEAEEEASRVQKTMAELKSEATETPITRNSAEEIQVAHDLADKVPDVVDQRSAFQYVMYYCQNRYPNFAKVHYELLSKQNSPRFDQLLSSREINRLIEALAEYATDIDTGIHNPLPGNTWHQNRRTSERMAQTQGKKYAEIYDKKIEQFNADLGWVADKVKTYEDRLRDEERARR